MLLGQLAGDDEFRARHQLPVRGRVGASSVTNKGFQQTLRFPTAGKPARYSLGETDGPGSLLGRQIFYVAHFRGLPYSPIIPLPVNWASEAYRSLWPLEGPRLPLSLNSE